MASPTPVPDHTLLRNIERKLMQKCSGTNKIRTSVKNGDATIDGIIRFEYERKQIIRVVNSVPGIRRVIDLMSVAVKTSAKEVVNWRKAKSDASAKEKTEPSSNDKTE